MQETGTDGGEGGQGPGECADSAVSLGAVTTLIETQCSDARLTAASMWRSNADMKIAPRWRSQRRNPW